MENNKRYPLAHAFVVAVELKRELDPHCERIEIVGSIRRQKPEVGDIELLYISKPGTRKVDLISDEEYGEAEKHLDWMLFRGIVSKRPNVAGVCSWGMKNKLAVHNSSGIPVDFFATSKECWWNSLVCRTGGKDNNLLITTTAQRQGYSFQAYGEGYRPVYHANPYDGIDRKFHATTSERDVYEFIALPYLEPKDRK